eukprot:comp22616_c0_seq1/m.34731 comp22616_c0_seq1/g.34731  ORF comp22616_c0_seq1/g.34731 comp22616_c0_seq1/m.34731 type:complete len:568 (-) comp22616_c0_seq1:14-1717(-)
MLRRNENAVRGTGAILVRVCVLGWRKSGKTALVTRFVEGAFEERYLPTSTTTRNKSVVLGGKQYEVEITDTPCFSVFSTSPGNLARQTYLNNDAFVLVYCRSERESLVAALEARERILEVRKDCPMVFVGTQVDAFNRRPRAVADGEVAAAIKDMDWVFHTETTATRPISNNVFTDLITMTTRYPDFEAYYVEPKTGRKLSGKPPKTYPALIPAPRSPASPQPGRTGGLASPAVMPRARSNPNMPTMEDDQAGRQGGRSMPTSPSTSPRASMNITGPQLAVDAQLAASLEILRVGSPSGDENGTKIVKSWDGREWEINSRGEKIVRANTPSPLPRKRDSLSLPQAQFTSIQTSTQGVSSQSSPQLNGANGVSVRTSNRMSSGQGGMVGGAESAAREERNGTGESRGGECFYVNVARKVVKEEEEENEYANVGDPEQRARRLLGLGPNAALESLPYFHELDKNLSRDARRAEIDRRLEGHKDGAWLLRFSSGSYVMSISYQGVARHLIIANKGGMYTVRDVLLPSVPQLLAHYHTNVLSPNTLRITLGHRVVYQPPTSANANIYQNIR